MPYFKNVVGGRGEDDFEHRHSHMTGKWLIYQNFCWDQLKGWVTSSVNFKWQTFIYIYIYKYIYIYVYT